MLFNDIFLYHIQDFSQQKLLVLRGSFVMQHWLSPYFVRPAKDIDFLANFPYNKAYVTELLEKIIKSIENDVFFKVSFTDIALLDTWIDTPTPAFRIHLTGFLNKKIENVKNQIFTPFAVQIDLAFGDTLTVEPVEWVYFSKNLQKNIKTLSICVEQALAWKIHGLVEFYDKGFRWQSKDLYDIYAILQIEKLQIEKSQIEKSYEEKSFFQINPEILKKCVQQAFLDKNTPMEIACQKIIDGSFGQSNNTSKQWAKFLGNDLQNQFTSYFTSNISHIEIIQEVRNFVLGIIKIL